MNLSLEFKPFSFDLLRTLQTAKGTIEGKRGWLIKLHDNYQYGWGEVSPINSSELRHCEAILKNLGSFPSRNDLEKGIKTWPGALGFGIGAALAEIDCLIGSKSVQGWLKNTHSAFLLPNDKSLLSNIDLILKSNEHKRLNLTFKWKVGTLKNSEEKKLLKKILEKIPSNAHLRIDANAGWNRIEAQEWAEILISEPRLEWLEQPLPPADINGLKELSKQIPIALDESLIHNPSLRHTWKGWQVRRPLLEGDPRILLRELNDKVGYRVISTCFETGIGTRWINHLAALQEKGPTPTAAGLAPGWCPQSNLFSDNPQLVWEAA
tara:strand:+ start:649 stop:1614 length:966 start_codon:yes stop_codon:yes gene_type:complete